MENGTVGAIHTPLDSLVKSPETRKEAFEKLQNVVGNLLKDCVSFTSELLVSSFTKKKERQCAAC